MQEPKVILVLTHAPDLDCAKRIARQLLAEKLTACINIGSQVLSCYEWESVVHETQEVPLVIKTTSCQQSRLIERLVELHPYELPEAVTIPVVGGYSPYIDWVKQATIKASE